MQFVGKVPCMSTRVKETRDKGHKGHKGGMREEGRGRPQEKRFVGKVPCPCIIHYSKVLLFHSFHVPIGSYRLVAITFDPYTKFPIIQLYLIFPSF